MIDCIAILNNNKKIKLKTNYDILHKDICLENKTNRNIQISVIKIEKESEYEYKAFEPEAGSPTRITRTQLEIQPNETIQIMLEYNKFVICEETKPWEILIY